MTNETIQVNILRVLNASPGYRSLTTPMISIGLAGVVIGDTRGKIAVRRALRVLRSKGAIAATRDGGWVITRVGMELV